jgi:hypothetical protein
MSEYDWHPVVALRWSTEGKLQQHWKRRVSNKRGIWYDKYDWRDVPVQEQPAPETLEDRQREPDAVEKQALYGNLRKLYRRDVPDETLDRSKPETGARPDKVYVVSPMCVGPLALEPGVTYYACQHYRVDAMRTVPCDKCPTPNRVT